MAKKRVGKVEATNAEASRGADSPPAWLFYATPERSKGAWRSTMRRGQILFWQHGLAKYQVGAPPYSRTMRRGDTVIIVTGDEIAATAVLAAAGDMLFRGDRNSRWWPLLIVEVFKKPVPRRSVEEGLKRNLISSRGAVHPLDASALDAVMGAFVFSPDVAYADLPFPREFAAAQLANGESLTRGLERQKGIHPDEATAARLVDEAPIRIREPLPKVFNDRADAKDLLNIDTEVKAFARLAISRGIDPPLSVGIFGDWGSGKSFFMEQVKRKIDDLTQESGDPAHPSHAALYAQVPQIRFNAWHYIETNLWASLVEFIFAELDRWLRQQDVPVDQVNALFDRLATSRQLKLEAYRELISAKKEAAAAEIALAEAKAKHRKAVHAPLSTADLWSVGAKAFIDGLSDQDKKALKEAAAVVGVDDLDASGQAAAKLVEDSADQANRARLILEAVVAQAGSVGGAALIIAALLAPAGAVFLLGLFMKTSTAAALHQLLAASALSLGALTGLGLQALNFARRHLNTLDKLRESLSAQVLEKTKTERKAVADAEVKAAQAAQSVADAERRARDAADHVAALMREQDNVSASGRLNRFIRDKVTNGDYARHLGIVASVHKDFGQLSVLLREQNDAGGDAARAAMEKANLAYAQLANALIKDAKAAGVALTASQVEELLESGKAAKIPTKIDRIVLYIDDLDRCPPDKVVDVLQAIHMLLFFPLFVVFVAVDARWLRRSLRVRYPDLIDAGAARAPGGMVETERAADAQDYLEKIFQIPFWVNPMSQEQGARFVHGLTKSLVTAPPEVLTKDVADGNFDQQDFDDDFALDEPLEVDWNEVEAADEAGLGSDAELVELSLSREEQRALSAFGALLGGSPRRTKRFVNTYLLIRIGRQLAHDEKAPEEAAWMIAAMLAVVVGAHEGADAFFQTAAEAKTLLSSADEFKRNVLLKAKGVRAPGLERILLEMTTRAGVWDADQLKRYAPLVKRYAF